MVRKEEPAKVDSENVDFDYRFLGMPIKQATLLWVAIAVVSVAIHAAV